MIVLLVLSFLIALKAKPAILEMDDYWYVQNLIHPALRKSNSLIYKCALPHSKASCITFKSLYSHLSVLPLLRAAYPTAKTEAWQH